MLGLSNGVKNNQSPKTNKLDLKIFEIPFPCHPELVSGSHHLEQTKMLNQVQHDKMGL